MAKRFPLRMRRLLLLICLFVISVAAGNGPPHKALWPVPQGYHSMAYHTQSKKVILTPVQANDIVILFGETWTYDMKLNSWKMYEGGPPRGVGPLAYDVQSKQMLMYIGAYYEDGAFYDQDLTLAFDLTTKTWTEMPPVTPGPMGTFGGRMVYDAESDKMIFFGAWSTATFFDTNETWAYDFDTNTWENMQPENAPPGLNFFNMSYDPVADKVVAWRRQISHGYHPLGYMIGIYDYNTNTWEQREVDPHPISHDYGAMVYDPNTGLNLMFGGVDWDYNLFNELWGYSVADNTWTLIPTTNTPSPRAWHAMVYHEKENKIMMFGGGTDRFNFTDEVWLLDPTTMVWEQVTN